MFTIERPGNRDKSNVEFKNRNNSQRNSRISYENYERSRAGIAAFGEHMVDANASSLVATEKTALQFNPQIFEPTC